jgi:hypothetical protein
MPHSALEQPKLLLTAEERESLWDDACWFISTNIIVPPSFPLVPVCAAFVNIDCRSIIDTAYFDYWWWSSAVCIAVANKKSVSECCMFVCRYHAAVKHVSGLSVICNGCICALVWGIYFYIFCLSIVDIKLRFSTCYVVWCWMVGSSVNLRLRGLGITQSCLIEGRRYVTVC